MNNNILVKLENYDHQYLRIKTYSRQRGRVWGFLLDKNLLSAHINNGFRETYYEGDGYNFISVSEDDDTFVFRINWLTSDGTDNIHGYRQTFEIPANLLKLILLGYFSCYSLLYNPDRKFTKIVNHAGRTLQAIQKNKFKRRALCKALRDNFNYHGDEIHLYNDGESFYFEEFYNGKRVMNGGLILHEYTTIGKDLTHYPSFRYSVHT